MHKKHESLFNHHRYSQSTVFSSLKSDQLAIVIVPILLLFIVSVVSVEKLNITAVLVYGAFPLFSMIAFRLPLKLIIYRLVMLSPFILIMAAANLFF